MNLDDLEKFHICKWITVYPGYFVPKSICTQILTFYTPTLANWYPSCGWFIHSFSFHVFNLTIYKCNSLYVNVLPLVQLYCWYCSDDVMQWQVNSYIFFYTPIFREVFQFGQVVSAWVISAWFHSRVIFKLILGVSRFCLIYLYKFYLIFRLNHNKGSNCVPLLMKNQLSYKYSFYFVTTSFIIISSHTIFPKHSAIQLLPFIFYSA